MVRPLLLFVTHTPLLLLLSDVCTAANRELLITTIKQDPYTMSKGSGLEGYCMDLLSELAKRLGFRYRTHLVRDGAYGRVDDAGAWNGMIGEVMRGEADMAVAPLTLTAARERVVGMTKPFMQTGISILMRKDMADEDDSLFDFLAPFSTQTWIGVLIAYLLTAACFCVVCRLSPPESEEKFTMLHSLWYAAGALSLQGAGPHPRSVSARVISCVWWVFGLVLLSCYFANLSASHKTSEPTHLMIKGFEDLANQEVIEYGTLAGSSTLSFFKNSNNPSYRRIYEHMERRKSLVASMDEGVSRAREGNYAFIGESVSLDLAVARYCELVRAHEVIGMRGYSIVTQLGSPMLKNLSIAILQLSEAGELAYLRSKWWASSCVGNGGDGSGVKGHGMRGVFILLAVGLGSSLLIALLELAGRARRTAQEQRKSCCTVLSQELSQRLRGGGGARTEEAAEKTKA
ncbi:glutamate receptor U1 [Engraulis encrasicolus]|uniref:glutamate receptor U1 n=1 Tax=Engraulis encrasicolus TaxID=184585 RepID=UPI002FD709B7